MYVQIRISYIYINIHQYIYMHLYKYMYTTLSAGTPPLTRPFCQILVFVACGFSSYRFVGLQHSRPHAFMMLCAIWRPCSLIVLNGYWSTCIYIYIHQYIYMHLNKYMYTTLSAGTPPLTRPFCQILVFVACGFSSYRFVGLQHSRPHAFMMLCAIWRPCSLIVLNGY